MPKPYTWDSKPLKATLDGTARKEIDPLDTSRRIDFTSSTVLYPYIVASEAQWEALLGPQWREILAEQRREYALRTPREEK